MKKVLYLNKKEGETPLETIKRYQKENPEYEKEKMTYAGRLDPMAEGVLIVLVGEECKKKEEYLGMNKEYEFEVLWGFKTDTYDILGLPQSTWTSDVQVEVGSLLDGLKGKKSFKYPPYSSMTVEGKQLFQWAREGRLDEIEIPEKEVEIYEIKKTGDYQLDKEELRTNIQERISLVKGDFRQEEILSGWCEEFEKDSREKYTVSKFKVTCSSGTYVRSIANKLGEKTGVGAIAFKINRTKIF